MIAAHTARFLTRLFMMAHSLYGATDALRELKSVCFVRDLPELIRETLLPWGQPTNIFSAPPGDVLAIARSIDNADARRNEAREWDATETNRAARRPGHLRRIPSMSDSETWVFRCSGGCFGVDAIAGNAK